MKYWYIILLILGVDALVLSYEITQLSISYNEALIVYQKHNLLNYIINSSLSFFGKNDFALRLPMLALHILSALLLYLTSKDYIKSEKHRVWLLVIFILLPGVLSSAIIVNSAGLVIFFLFFFIYIYQNFHQRYLYILLIIYALIEKDLFYLFLSLSIYSLYIKDRVFFLFNIVLLSLSLELYGFNIQGIPSGHFMDTLAVYTAIFSPIIFIYIFYVLYKRFLTKEIDIVWFIATIPFISTLLLSFRERINIEDIAPYLIVSLLFTANTFISSYRVRLKIFRKFYKNTFIVSLILLIINSLIVLFNQELYRYIENPKKHFVYDMHIAKEIAISLKAKEISCVSTDKEMALRLKFYNINNCSTYRLKEIDSKSNILDSVTVSYANRVVYKATVTKLNNK
jgi:hypothetical protein